MGERKGTGSSLAFILLSFFCSLTSHRIPLSEALNRLSSLLKGLKYLTIKNTTYHVLSIGSLLKTLLPFFFISELINDVPETTLRDGTEKGVGGGPRNLFVVSKCKVQTVLCFCLCCRRFKVQEHLPAIQKKPCSELCNSCTVMF